MKVYTLEEGADGVYRPEGAKRTKTQRKKSSEPSSTATQNKPDIDLQTLCDTWLGKAENACEIVNEALTIASRAKRLLKL